MNNVQGKSKHRSNSAATLARHRELAARLLEVAETVIAQSGLETLRARDLAHAAGCSVGAIYGIFPTLDSLIMAVNDRTLAALESEIPMQSLPDAPEAQLVGFAVAYLTFAAREPKRWAALFKHRLPPNQAVSADYEARQAAIFARVTQPIARLCPCVHEPELLARARTLFSAVHGVVQLGLEQKLGVLEPGALEAQLRWLIGTMAAGLRSQPRT